MGVCGRIKPRMFRKTWQKIKKRKGVVLLLVLVGLAAGFFILQRGGSAPDYDFTVAERKNLAQEVIVTGSVKPAERVELAFERTGTVSRILTDVGERVRAGELLAQLDTKDAQTEVRNAEVQLEIARVNLEKTQLEYAQFLRGDTLNESLEDGLAILANFYDEYQTLLDDLDSIYFGTSLAGESENNIRYYADYTDKSAVASRLERMYETAETLYQQGFSEYQAAQRGTGEARQKAIQSGYALAVHTADMVKVGRDVIRSFQNEILVDSTVHSKQAAIDEHIASLTTHSATISGYVTDLLAVTTAINSQQDSQENYPLSIASQELTVRQREIDLQEAQDNLARYSIVAPMDAVLAKRDIRVGETVLANSSVLTIISEAEYEVEANVPEADIAKLQRGNSALLTLDAYGHDEVFQTTVTKVDPAEIVIEGVPTYKITLQFTKADPRIHSGMTANINIQSAKKDNVIALPQRALIREDGKKYVRVLRGEAIERVEVETGLQGSDGNIEILSGIEEGDKVIVFLQEGS